MRLKTNEELEVLKNKLGESNQQATDRIRNELRAETKENNRKNAVMDYFFILTGKPMTLEQYNKYIKKFDSQKTPGGYNIKSFIKEENLNDHVIEKPFRSPDEYIKEQMIEIQADKILEEYREDKKNEQVKQN